MGTVNAGLFTSTTDEWPTPADLFGALWTGTVWMNPPYGRVIGSWIKKAWESSTTGATVVCLIPARTDTAYWHEYVMRAAEVRFIAKRLHFDYAGHQARKATGASVAHNAPFPSVVVVFRPGRHRPVMSAIARDGSPVPVQA